MSEELQIVDILLNICIKGCFFSEIIPHLAKRSIKLKTEIEKYFPESMNNIISSIDGSTKYKFFLNGIGTKYFITVYFYFDNICHSMCMKINTQVDSNIVIFPYCSFYGLLTINNNNTINKLIHMLYTGKEEVPTSSQLDVYKRKLWDFMYDKCFGPSIGILYLSICNRYLIPDITKIIIGNILIQEKWNNLGFSCV